jgi:hypothetical protein
MFAAAFCPPLTSLRSFLGSVEFLLTHAAGYARVLIDIDKEVALRASSEVVSATSNST